MDRPRLLNLSSLLLLDPDEESTVCQNAGVRHDRADPNAVAALKSQPVIAPKGTNAVASVLFAPSALLPVARALLAVNPRFLKQYTPTDGWVSIACVMPLL